MLEDKMIDVLANLSRTATCQDHDVMQLLRSMYGTNDSVWVSHINGTFQCQHFNQTGHHSDIFDSLSSHHEHDLEVHDTGKDFYAYLTPIIIIVGIFGNLISLKVFTSKVMRRLSSSLYLVALSGSDLTVLMTYVFLDWLNRGLQRWPGGHRVPVMNINGVCQLFMYVTYAFRFISAWLIVIFAVERNIAVCKPFSRKRLCTKGYAKKLILLIFVIAFILCLYKPILSVVHSTRGDRVCTRNINYDEVNFVLDTIYALLIIAVPSLVILGLNIPILHRLMTWNSTRRNTNVVVKEKKIRLEFTVIMLTISSCFICLNLPYFVIWCQQFHQSLNPGPPTVADRLSGQLYITRTIFYINYCINFFLYCLTGAYYRQEIKSMFRYYFMRQRSTLTSHADERRNVNATQQTKCNMACSAV